ncbi:hypothetical protein Ciccas_013190 [Cichlidogyrus casuarinus]|uniref:Peptidase C1A papain C-terminal domain-containing protein n=1 Tax=Cichlidogyrus casuarinus TaxID=1844966 RepID=A0ABD2PLC1_9PLAT
MLKIIVVSVIAIASVAAVDDLLLEDIAERVNAQKNTWTATVYPRFANIEDVKRMIDVRPNRYAHRDNMPKKPPTHMKLNDMPKEFDVRDKWGHCSSIGQIRDQGDCAAGWAFAGANTMTDRLCINSGRVDENVSEADLLTCCFECASGLGCEGGDLGLGFGFWENIGIVSGGEYGSNQGCIPYPLPPVGHATIRPRPTPQCQRKCREGYEKKYINDRTRAEEWEVYNSELELMTGLIAEGSIAVNMDVHSDFPTYRGGIYHHITDTVIGSHSARLIGWGEENGIKFWRMANSWGVNWGENGFFRILRGSNECGVESYAISAKPRK